MVWLGQVDFSVAMIQIRIGIYEVMNFDEKRHLNQTTVSPQGFSRHVPYSKQAFLVARHLATAHYLPKHLHRATDNHDLLLRLLRRFDEIYGDNVANILDFTFK